MLAGVFGKKIGMTQIFGESKVIPVTVIDYAHWYTVGVKTKDRDGYDALQLGLLKKRYRNQEFSLDWLKKLKQYFTFVREIPLADPIEEITVGESFDFSKIIQDGELVNVFGTTIGRGFQGVMKRHGFSGGPASHGSNFKRRPGSIGSYATQGRVIKGTKMPGHMGVEKRVMKNLKIVRIEPAEKILLVQGSVPGGSGALLYIQKV